LLFREADKRNHQIIRGNFTILFICFCGVACNLKTQTQEAASAVSSGGLGFTVGRASQKTTQTDDSNVKKGSLVGSTQGNLALFAGNLLNVHGSKLFAGKDMALAGSDVNITAAENSHTTQLVSEQ
jgi:filamentous hemagglutinin